MNRHDGFLGFFRYLWDNMSPFQFWAGMLSLAMLIFAITAIALKATEVCR